MGLSKKDIERFKELDEKAYHMFLEGMSLVQIGNILGVKRQSLSKRLKEKYNIEVMPNGKKSINDNFFNIIDTSQKAYWLGFFYADGYVSDTRNTIDLCLKESDKEHLEKFKKILNSNHKISEKKNILNGKEFYSYRISIRSKALNDDLKKHGCINNKSLVCTFPNVDENLLPDFIRGYFDGDGCIYFDKRSKRILPKINMSCGSRKFISSLQNILNDKFNIKSNLYIDRNIYSLRIYKEEDVYSFLNLIYENSNEDIRLNRKYNLYTICRPKTKTTEVLGV